MLNASSQPANVTIVTEAQTTEITGDGKKVNGLSYKDLRERRRKHTLELEGVFVQIGLVPNTEWLKGTVELSPRGEIVVDARGATSVPGVFAAGDCTAVPFKQIVIAMGEGAKAQPRRVRPPDPRALIGRSLRSTMRRVGVPSARDNAASRIEQETIRRRSDREHGRSAS